MLRGINPGLMDVRLRIQAPTASRNAIGEDVETFQTIGYGFVERLRKQGRESFESDQQVGFAPVEYRGRYSAFRNVTQKCRVTEDASKTDDLAVWYYVRSVEHHKREGHSIIIAEKRDNQ